VSADFCEAALAIRKIRASNSATAADNLKTRAFDNMQPHPESRTPIPFPGGPAIRSGGSVDSGQSVGARNSVSSGNSAGLGPLIRACQDDALDTGDDVRLIAQIADGQSGALSELYRRRGGALFRFLQRILGDAPDTEETLQDTFVAIWRRAGGYEPSKSGPLTWMIMIARGLALDRLRQRTRRLSGLERLKVADSSEEVSTDTAYSHLAADEQSRRLGSALGSLPDNQRTAIELAFYRGCTQDEIARVTGEPLGTIKARIRRGMLSLRLRLQNRHE
jgi:RNA polymerase sigma-70 factor (ECF subfamily)